MPTTSSVPDSNPAAATQCITNPSGKSARLQSGRIPEIDGLRAFAILPVMLFHFAPETGGLRGLAPIFRIGWVGVDLFFVLSGYLITGILLDTVKQDHFYRTFVTRRIFRIFPLYYACLALFTVSTYFVSGRETWHGILNWGSPMWFALFLGNFRAAYLNSFPPVFSFVPLWSLQVEEQFYLLYPALIALCAGRTVRRVLIGSILFAPALRAVLTFFVPGSNTACFVLAPCRMDALAWGGLLAMAYRSNRFHAWARQIGVGALFSFGACMLWFSFPSFTHRYNTILAYSLVDLCFAGVLSQVLSHSDSLLVRSLRWRPLVYIGTCSYGLYLLHGPAGWLGRSIVTRIVSIAPNGTANLLISLVFSFGAAAMSWELFESRVLALRGRLFDQTVRTRSNTGSATSERSSRVQTPA